jgi:hypothetical protein
MLGGHLRIERMIGSGGMGVVYLATNVRLQRPVAVKVQRSEGGGEGTARLIREAQSLARLTHPNVLTVYDVGEHGNAVYISMEYVDGGTARTWLQERPRPWRQILALYVQAARGLAAAHAAGIVHRDFKPENCLLGRDGRVRVADFGIAQGLGAPHPQTPHPRSNPGGHGLDPGLTMTGGMMGPPAYMAPEQLAGVPVDGRADQFAFCVSLLEALHGRRPFLGPTPGELLLQIRAGAIQAPPAGTRVPAWLSDSLRKGLHPDPAHRHTSMDALLAELTRARGSQWLWPIVGGGGGLSVLVLIGAAVAWSMWGTAPVTAGSTETDAGPTEAGESASETVAIQVGSSNPEPTRTTQEAAAPVGPPAPQPDLPPVSKEPLWDGRSTLVCAGSRDIEIIGKTISIDEGPAFQIGGDCQLAIRDCEIDADIILAGGGSDEVRIVLERSKVKARTSVVKMGGGARAELRDVEVLGPTEDHTFDLRGNVDFHISGTDSKSAEVIFVSGAATAHINDGRFEGSEAALVATGASQVVLGSPEFVGPMQQSGLATVRRHAKP